MSLTLRCPAKLNLGLEVVARRADGYHEIRTLFQSIDLADGMQVEACGSGIEVQVEGADLPAGGGNLVHRAAEALAAHLGERRGARFLLHKRIPVGAGLGGGSSDAAVALMALDRLWGAELGPSGLTPLAEGLGSDVSYFLHGGLCLGLGRGEKLFPVDWKVPALTFVLVCLPESLSTAQVYADLGASLTSGAKDSRLRRFLASALAGEEAWDVLANDLEEPAARRAPALTDVKSALRRKGARTALMSGSGPSVFGVFLETQQAEAAALELRAAGHQVHRCRALARAEYREYIGLAE